MRKPRPRPQLLSYKLRAIRNFLSLVEVDMASKLTYELLSHSHREYELHPARIWEYENDRREPNLFVLLAYARLAQVHMESLVDDNLGIDTFRTRLGNEGCYFTTSPAPVEPPPVKKRLLKKRTKPMTLLTGTR